MVVNCIHYISAERLRQNFSDNESTTISFLSSDLDKFKLETQMKTLTYIVHEKQSYQYF